MRPVVSILVIVVFYLCYNVGTGKSQEVVDFEEQDEDGRRNSAQAYARGQSSAQAGSAKSQAGANVYNPGLNQQLPNFGPAPVPRPSLGQCYSCTDCPTILPNTTVRQCGFTAPTCVVYSEKFNHLTKPIYIRGCVSERGSCDDVRRSHEGHQNVLKLMSCEECFGDKCNTNGVSRSLPDFTSALLFMIVIPVIKKYTLS